MRTIPIVLAFILALSGCSTTHYVYNVSYDTAKKELRPGQKVMLETSGGEQRKFKIQRIEEECLLTDTGQAIPYSEIRKISANERSAMPIITPVAMAIYIPVAIAYGAVVIPLSFLCYGITQNDACTDHIGM